MRERQVNVVGHFSASSGLGNAARAFTEVLVQQEYQVAGFDVDYHGSSKRAVHIPGVDFVDQSDRLPFATTIFIVTIQMIPSLWVRRTPSLLTRGHRNVVLLFWELPAIPPAWVPALAAFDAAIVCSRFVETALRTALPAMPIVWAPHPLQKPARTEPRANVRRRYRIPDSALAFFTNFDPRSDLVRKNPLSTLEAFQTAFSHNEDVCLVIKTNATFADSKGHPVAEALLNALAEDPRIIAITATLEHADVMSVYDACDVYVSLHRSEGLGLGPLEAMALGKTVIATAFSGNMTFMNAANSLPVDYELVIPSRTSWQFMPQFAGPSALWANPSVAKATAAMQWCFTHPQERQRLGEQARADLVLWQAEALSGRYFDEALTCAKRHWTGWRRLVLKLKLVLTEWTDPTFRALNLKAAGAAIHSRIESRKK